MVAPAYHLRPNKAVDRHLFIEALHHWGRTNEMDKYIYYGLGGPYLEDFRLMHENFPNMKMVSIENSEQVYKRQQFHRPTGKVQLEKNELRTFLNTFDPKEKKFIFWLDYTDLKFSNFQEFEMLLGMAPQNSFVKITLKCEMRDHQDQLGKDDKEKAFISEFSELLPGSDFKMPHENKIFAKLVQDMLQISAEKALPSSAGDRVFFPISTFFYKDGDGIFTLTGMIGIRSDLETEIKNRFGKWKFSNLEWKNDPKHIDVPFLSAKERLHLQKFLPCTGKTLKKKLKYRIGENNTQHLRQMNAYADFYRQYPYFIKAVI